MTKYREIIRLTGLGFSQRNIMASCGVSQKTVVKVQKRARELNISWPLDESMTDTELQKLMFSKESKVSANKRIPDYAYIRKELLRNGVSKKLLWTEYMEDCRAKNWNNSIVGSFKRMRSAGWTYSLKMKSHYFRHYLLPTLN